jgi:cytochrome c556
MKRLMAPVLVFAFAASAAYAESDDAVAQRRTLMKANGDATKPVVEILKGAPYDPAAVKAALKAYANAAAKMPSLFPPGSKIGGDTAALPAIWDNKADLDARFAKFGQEATAAAAAIKDSNTFKANMPTVLKNCGGCHELYKAKQS